MPKTICLDFNGVLDQYAGYAGGKEYPPAEGAHEFMETLKDHGYHLVILTAIEPDKVWAWLTQYHMNHLIDRVTNTKPPAFVYVDDRAICHRGNFEDTLREIENFKAHWEKG